MKQMIRPILALLAFAWVPFATTAQAADDRGQRQLEQLVNTVIEPVMKEHSVPGMAVAITVKGKRYVFNYGVASKASGQKVGPDTLFEVGSLTKTFTGVLAAYAQERGALSLKDSASKHLPALGSNFDGVSLLDLGTFTAALPLWLPAGISDQERLVTYLKSWRPPHAVGTHRLYSNPSIGLFGQLVAKSMGNPYDDLMQQMLLPKFGLTRTYLKVPRERMNSFAYGYSKDDKPVRFTLGFLGEEAGGLKSTAADMIRYVELNIDGAPLDEPWRRAIAVAQTGYYEVGDMMQGLGWEMYAYPVSLDQLLAGNSPDIVFKSNKVSRPVRALPSPRAVWINKTGSTSGFGTYVAFVPAKGIGIVMLANRNYPVPARIKAAHQILNALDNLPSATGVRRD
jgi:beta-lactamase class C